jgi:hypothetical protein
VGYKHNEEDIMGWFIFLGIVVIVIVVVKVVSAKKKKKVKEEAIANMPQTYGYQVAKLISDALTQNGYTVVENEIDYYELWGASVSFRVTSTSDSVCCGHIEVDTKAYRRRYSHYANNDLLRKNKTAMKGYFYAIQNEFIDLSIFSDIETQEVPQFLEIAANVMVSTGYKFQHPDWMDEYPEAKKYLNVMFQ